jgi:hypothetical protein
VDAFAVRPVVNNVAVFDDPPNHATMFWARTGCVLSQLRTAGISMRTISESITSKPHFREARRRKSVTPLEQDLGAIIGHRFTTGRQRFSGVRLDT